MADTPDVQDSEITLDMFDGEQDAPKAEPSPAKPEAKADDKTPEKVEGEEDKGKADDTAPKPDAPPKEDEEAKPDEAKADESKEEPAPEDKPKGAEDRKEQLNKDIDQSKKDLGIDPNTEIRDLVSARNALRDVVSQATSEAYDVKTEKTLADEINPETGEKYTSIEAKVEAMAQEAAMSKYNAEVVDRQLVLGQESMQVLQDFPIFNSSSDQYDKELAQEAAELLDANLIRDDNVPEIGSDGKPTGRGMVIGATVSPYRLYKTLARASGISAAKGQIKGQQDTEEQLANVDAPTSSSPPPKKEDPLMALWKED